MLKPRHPPRSRESLPFSSPYPAVGGLKHRLRRLPAFPGPLSARFEISRHLVGTTFCRPGISSTSSPAPSPELAALPGPSPRHAAHVPLGNIQAASLLHLRSLRRPEPVTMTPGRGSHPPLADEEHQLEAYPVHPPSTAVSTISSSLTHTFEAHSESQKPLGYSSIVYPSRKDRFGNGPDRNWWWVAKVILRSFSLTFAAILIVVEIYVLYDTPSEIRDASSASAIWSVVSSPPPSLNLVSFPLLTRDVRPCSLHSLSSGTRPSLWPFALGVATVSLPRRISGSNSCSGFSVEPPLQVCGCRQRHGLTGPISNRSIARL